MEKLRKFPELATVTTEEFRTNFEKISSLIRKTYIDRQENRDLQWPPCFAEKLVKLELHQEVYNVYYNKQRRGERYSSSNREQVGYDGIFESKPSGRKVKKVLVEGDAGIGKTTLCTSISVEWAQKKRLKQFKLLLLLPLRDKDVISTMSVFELLQVYHPHKMICESVANGLMQGQYGEQVLIIADGWDELEQSRKNPSSFIYKLLFKNAIHSATVLITSRPSASVALHKNPYIDRFIEIAGFDKKGIEQYIKSEFPNDFEKESRDGLLQQISNNPMIRSICHVPINCAILCHMWRSDASLPSDISMTDIYTKIILHFILRALQKKFPDFGIESLNSFDAIPEFLHDHLWLLCKLAYDALLKDTFVFSYDELESIFPQSGQLSAECFTFGLMQSAQGFVGIGRGVSFHFLHRTFQEFLSALHVATQPPNKQVELMKLHVYSSRMEIVSRFILGFGRSEPGTNLVSSKLWPFSGDIIHLVYEVDNRVRSFCFGWTCGIVVHGIYEVKDVEVLNYLLKTVYGDHFTFAFPRNAHDCAAVINAVEKFENGLVIAKKDSTSVSFKFEHCGLDDELLVNLALALHATEGRLHVKTLLIQDNKLSDESVSMLMELAALSLKSLKRLSLAANSIGAEAVTAISDYLGETSMECLILSYNPLDSTGALALTNVIRMNALASLIELQLKNCLIKDAHICLSLFQVLSDCCSHLKILDISENHIMDSKLAGESLGKLLQANKNLYELYVNEINLGDEGVKALTDVLTTSGPAIHLSVLSMKNNSISCDGIILLAKSVQASLLSVSNSLLLDSNPIQLKGLVGLCSVLNSKSISMCECQLSASTQNCEESYVEKLAKIPETELCQELLLDCNCFSGENVHILVELIRICPKLSSLSCVKCELDSSDIKNLLGNTVSLTELETWSLQSNNLSDRGCSHLVASLDKYLPKVTGIFLHDNPKITKVRLLQSLETKISKHRTPSGDKSDMVCAALLPGVPQSKLKYLLDAVEAYENYDEDIDPALIWDEYSRWGEEQRQQAELLVGLSMSFGNETLTDEALRKVLATPAWKRQELGASVMSDLRSLQRIGYEYQPHSYSDEEDINLSEAESDEQEYNEEQSGDHSELLCSQQFHHESSTLLKEENATSCTLPQSPWSSDVNKGEGSKEYLTFIQCTQDLRLAVRSHLLSLGASLIAKHVITPDQEEELRNHHHSVGDRAATLIKLVQDKVRQDPKYYHIFMDILGKDLSQNRGILEILRNTYEPMQLQATSGMPVEIQGNTSPVVPVVSPIPVHVQMPAVVVDFTPNLSVNEFMSYLKKEGLSDQDCDIMKANGIGAKTFATDFGDNDINSPELGFTFGGKKLLRQLLRDRLTGADGQAIQPIEFNEDDKKQISIDGDGEEIAVDYFDPYEIDRFMLHPLRFSFGVVNPRQGVKVSNVDKYDMSKFPHGIALIINNESFDGKEKRIGTAVDQRHLTHAFRYLGYTVEVHREVNSERMMAIMSEMGKRSHDQYDSFVCCILSHGSAGHVFGTDGMKVSLDALTQRIDAQRCPSLRNKPKLFFLQACRGELREMTVAVGSDGDIRATPDEIPQTADFFFGHATPLGHVAWRDFNHGSWYISELCRTLCEMSTYASLNDIMTQVCSRVASGEKYKMIGYKMTPESTTRLQGNVYF